MEGFDDPGVFFSDNFGVDDNQDDLQINRQQIKNRLREFIRKFHEGNFTYTYRFVSFVAKGYWCVGNWTTRGYANSRIGNSRTGHLADWSARGLLNSTQLNKTSIYGRMCYLQC